MRDQPTFSRWSGRFTSVYANLQISEATHMRWREVLSTKLQEQYGFITELTRRSFRITSIHTTTTRDESESSSFRIQY